MLFAVLADATVKSAAVLVAAWIVALLLCRRSAAARHLLWTAAFAAVLALPFLSVSLPELPVRGTGAILPSAAVFQTTATARAGTPPNRETRAKPSGRQPQPGPWRPDWPLWITIAWIAGAATLTGQMIAACVTMSRARRLSAAAPDRALHVEMATALGIRHPVEVLESPAGTMPMTYGVLRPAVFLPADSTEWDDGLRRAVLLHELAHVRRGDVAAQILARLALALHWWNPLAWMAWRQFLRERERATDDMVLGMGVRASDYAGHLLQMARSGNAAPTLAWAAVAMARRSQLEQRLAAILDARTSRAVVGRVPACFAAVAAVALVAPLAAVHAEHAAPEVIVPVIDAAIRPTAPTPGQNAIQASTAAAPQQDSEKRSLSYGAGLLKIADLEQRRNNSAEAEAFYRKAAAVLGDSAEAASAWLYLGIRKNPIEAIECLRKAERLDPAHAGPARMWMALMYELLQKPGQAEALYKSALAAEKSESEDAGNTLQLYANFLKKQGRSEEAQKIEAQAAAARRAMSRASMSQIQGSRVQNIYRVGPGVRPPSLLSKVEPEYSEEARIARYQGRVVIYAEIGTDGIAHNLHVLEGLGLGLDEKALKAIDRWRFRPGSKEGNPVPVAATIEVNFRLL
jgi:TonB family protein